MGKVTTAEDVKGEEVILVNISWLKSHVEHLGEKLESSVVAILDQDH